MQTLPSNPSCENSHRRPSILPGCVESRGMSVRNFARIVPYRVEREFIKSIDACGAPYRARTRVTGEEDWRYHYNALIGAKNCCCRLKSFQLFRLSRDFLKSVFSPWFLKIRCRFHLTEERLTEILNSISTPNFHCRPTFVSLSVGA